MQDSAFTIFIGFGCIWIVMGVVAVIALLKSDQQEIRLGKQGLIVTISILAPTILALAYQVMRTRSNI